MFDAMGLDERVKLARLAYMRAIAAVKDKPTSVKWARLLTAAKNLNEAARARDQRREQGDPLGRSP